MPQPTVQYVQLGQEPSMAHPVMQYDGIIAFLFPKLTVVKLHKTILGCSQNFNNSIVMELFKIKTHFMIYSRNPTTKVLRGTKR